MQIFRPLAPMSTGQLSVTWEPIRTLLTCSCRQGRTEKLKRGATDGEGANIDKNDASNKSEILNKMSPPPLSRFYVYACR